ncbi:GntR family transcriptional regulator [Aquibacillus salsiterrae]|uniref:GntR family transcriptional regulator n=1 Tax=Aquibacillus salsiterrae TaxID=2950439 RepID=A0A9X4AEA5_9BACI|nr:GntR family transcriptional regulator [Aquibacillus salsiterrae]MDC3416617.1 GntR family transcriptional regulator [Aquibacillus salsiterrae]
MKSLYEKVYDSLKQEITSGKYQRGERLPSEKEISENFQVSRITSKKALEKLVMEGYVYRQRGKGTFVSNNRPGNSYIQRQKPLIGLIITAFNDSFGSGLINSLEKESDGNCFIILKRSLGDPEKEEKLVKELVEYGVDGLIVYPAHSEHYSSEILKLVINKFPLILIDRVFKGLGTTSVATDNQEAAQNGVNYLFNIGHERIGVLMPINYEMTTIEERLSGIVRAYAEKQIRVEKELWCYNIKSTLPIPLCSKQEDIDVIKEHIKANPKMTAIFALEYNIAILAKKAVEQMGMRVPNDISILCFDSPCQCQHHSEWSFTHLKQNEEELGKKAVHRLLSMFEGEITIKKDRISATLKIGNSTKPLV